MNESQTINTLDELLRHYPKPRARSRSKIQTSLTEPMQTWLTHSPFFILSSVSTEGLDCSPRGDLPGEAFRVLDAYTIAIPDRRGNNRIDTLRNILEEPQVGLVFMVPGVDEALRIKGHASISIEPDLLKTFSLNGAPPATVMVIHVVAAYVQNARAIRQSGLWNPASQHAPKTLPSAAELSGLEPYSGSNRTQPS